MKLGALGMAFLTKGQICLLITFGSFLLYFLATTKKFAASKLLSDFRQLRILKGLAIVAALATPWFATAGITTHGKFLYDFFIVQNIQRASGTLTLNHEQPFWFYIHPGTGCVSFLSLIPISHSSFTQVVAHEACAVIAHQIPFLLRCRRTNGFQRIFSSQRQTAHLCFAFIAQPLHPIIGGSLHRTQINGAPLSPFVGSHCRDFLYRCLFRLSTISGGNWTSPADFAQGLMVVYAITSLVFGICVQRNARSDSPFFK